MDMSVLSGARTYLIQATGLFGGKKYESVAVPDTKTPQVADRKLNVYGI